MKRAFLLASCVALLAACDGNPLDPIPIQGGPAPDEEGGADGSVVDNCDGTNEVCTGEVNVFVYDDRGTADPSDDRLRINNLPFDLTGRYAYVGMLNGYQLFENTAGDERYVAIYAEGDFGAGGGVVGTDGYVDFGYGGTVQRSDGATLPREGEAVFEGPYAGIRVPDDGGVMRLVTGDARMRLDFEDFDITGAADGTITNRVIVGTGDTLPYVAITTTGFDGIQIDATAAEEVPPRDDDPDTPERGVSGTVTGIFGGTVGSSSNEAEITGIVDMSGPNYLNDEVDVRERGVFTIPQVSFTRP